MGALGEQFRRWYPGLIPVEARLWRAFLRQHEGEFDAFEYNVLVGEGVRIADRRVAEDDELDRKLKEQYRQATQRKIDVVGLRTGETWIFEVEERPGTRALGQLLTYQTLLPATRRVVGPTQLAIVAARVGFDMLRVFDEQSVIVFQIPAEELV